MLFNSTPFLFAFFPVVFLIFFVLGGLGLRRLASAWLFVSSLTFYGWDDPSFLIPLILASITFNYFVGRAIAATRNGRILAFGIVADLGLLAYFKYANFIAENLAFAGEWPQLATFWQESIARNLLLSTTTLDEVIIQRRSFSSDGRGVERDAGSVA